MRALALGVCMIIVSPCVSNSGDLVVGESARATGASEVLLVVLKDDDGFGDAVSGGIVKDYPRTENRAASSGGIISWKSYREKVDADRSVHSYYEQRYTPAKGQFRFHEDPPEDGYKIAGGYLAYHSTMSIDPYLVSGAVHKDIATIRTPTLLDKHDAVRLAAEIADQKGDIEVDFAGYGDLEIVSQLVDSTELWLHPTDKQYEFGFVWHVPVLAKGRGAVPVLIDAESSKLLATSPPMNWSPACGPDTSITELVEGTSQNLSLGTFGLEGTQMNDPAGWECLHAHVPMTAVTPSIQVLRGQSSSWCADQMKYVPAHAICVPGMTNAQYDNIEVQNPYGYQCYPGRSMTDAMRHAVTTFDVFWNSLGREGISGAGIPFRIVVDGRCIEEDSGYVFSSLNRHAPVGSVLVCGGILSDPDTTPSPTGGCPMYDGPSLTVALDFIAHEIGHGVIIASAGISHQSTPGDEFHEGFADVIGHGVQNIAESVGGINNWELGEDTGTVVRRADTDTGELRFFYGDTQHDGSAHARGTPLPVAMRLLAEGGINPACSGVHNQPNAAACAENVGSEGLETAFKVFYTLLDTYLQPSTDWSAFPSLIVAAAARIDGSGQPEIIGFKHVSEEYEW